MNMPHRMKIKYFVQKPQEITLDTLIPIFHRWIQTQSGDDLLIDVADYQHVPNGPGVLLMGHQADYALDMAEGRPGLIYLRKRLNDSTDIATELMLMFRQVLQGCQKLEQEDCFDLPIHFHMDEFELTFSDRLNTPNQAQFYNQLQPLVQPVLDKFYGEGATQMEQVHNDSRQPLSIRIKADYAPALNTLLQN